MQYRMRSHQLTEEETNTLLLNCKVGTLATINLNGMPYNVPMHYVFLNNAIYIHGLPIGQKIDNLKVNPNVSFNIYEMYELLLDRDEKPCDTNTAYSSVVIQGIAHMVEDLSEKETALSAIVKKYTPHLSEKQIPLNMLNGTAVIRISICEITGKYYR